MIDATGLFSSSPFYDGPRLTEAQVSAAEQELGVTLPRSYVGLLSIRNGGKLLRNCFATNFSTSWAPDHFKVRALLGIGGEWGIDASGGVGSRYLTREWDYPDIGVVIVETPSGGHDTVMLDYTASGPDGDPRVAYIDEDRVPRVISSTFEEFINGLVVESEFG